MQSWLLFDRMYLEELADYHEEAIIVVGTREDAESYCAKLNEGKRVYEEYTILGPMQLAEAG